MEDVGGGGCRCNPGNTAVDAENGADHGRAGGPVAAGGGCRCNPGNAAVDAVNGADHGRAGGQVTAAGGAGGGGP